MCKSYSALLWCPEELASHWTTLPQRAGFVVRPTPPDMKRNVWEARATWQPQMNDRSGIRADMRIDDALIKKAISFDQSAWVSGGAAAVLVTVSKDQFRYHDASGSWWMELWPVSESILKDLVGDSHVQLDWRLFDLMWNTLVWSFVASGAKLSRGVFVPSQPTVEAELFVCPVELARQWPARISDSNLRWKLFPLLNDPNSSAAETFLCGRLGRPFGDIAIHSGPAIEHGTQNEVAYLAVATTGLLPQKRLLKKIMSEIAKHGGKQL